MTTRRLVLTRSAAVIGAASTGLLLPEMVRAQSDKVRVGFMLPYTGTFAQLGVAIENGFRMALNEQGGKLGGRELNFSSDIDLVFLFAGHGETTGPRPLEHEEYFVRAGKRVAQLPQGIVFLDQNPALLEHFL